MINFLLASNRHALVTMMAAYICGASSAANSSEVSIQVCKPDQVGCSGLTRHPPCGGLEYLTLLSDAKAGLRNLLHECRTVVLLEYGHRYWKEIE